MLGQKKFLAPKKCWSKQNVRLKKMDPKRLFGQKNFVQQNFWSQKNFWSAPQHETDQKPFSFWTLLWIFTVQKTFKGLISQQTESGSWWSNFEFWNNKQNKLWLSWAKLKFSLVRVVDKVILDLV